MACPTPIIAVIINQITIVIPFAVLITLGIHTQRKKILGGIINKPSYQLGTAYFLNSIYVITGGAILLILILFIFGPIIVPGEYANCVSPLA